MGPWTYYSPLWLGTIVAFAVFANSPRLDWLPADGLFYWTIGVVGSLLLGALCQLGMFGLQGAAAQVMPVPFGRSIRGRGAKVTGFLWILAIVATLAAGLVASDADSRLPVLILGAGAAALAVCGVISYIWCASGAIPDFGAE